MAGAVEVEVAIGYSRCRGKVAFPSKYMSIETNIIDITSLNINTPNP
jgi:hypothetical protein